MLRFIDVENNCLAEVKEMTKYVALSYIWGDVESLRLTAANKSQLLMRQSLNSRSSELPITIRDAIRLVRKAWTPVSPGRCFMSGSK